VDTPVDTPNSYHEYTTIIWCCHATEN
jgi:hypothetical protein